MAVFSTANTSDGIWTLREARRYIFANTWPQPSPETANIIRSLTAADEGNTVIFTVNTTLVENTTLFYSISGTGITANDFTSNTLTGNISIANSSGTVSVTFSEDLTTEGSETLTFSVRQDSVSGNILASTTVDINDTSTTPETNGSKYADSYLATTGGSLIEVTSGSGSLNTTIDNASDGDAILLSPGSYTIDALGENTFFSDPFRYTNILLVGDTDTCDDVVVTVDHDGASAVRDHGIFVGAQTSSTPSVNRQAAFLVYKRQQTSGTNYISSLVRINGTPKPKGRMVNVYFDNNNGDISWHYDNAASTGTDVEFVRCTFANYANWDASYSGRDDQVDVENCLFDGSTDTSEYVDGGGNVTSATVNTTTRSYDTGTYPTAGHLYVPNTTAVF